MEDSTARSIQLRAGRRLGYAEWGDPGGRPLLYFHGWPGSRVEGRLGDDVASAMGVRFIALDRPGMGRRTISQAGGVVISEEVATHVKGLDLQDLGPVALKGLAAPMRLFRARR